MSSLTSGEKLPSAKVIALTPIVDKIPDEPDLVFEIKDTLREALKHQKKDALKHIQLRLDSMVLINDFVTPKRSVFRATLKVLEAFGAAKRQSAGKSVVETTIDSIFDPDTHSEANKNCHSLHVTYINSTGGFQPTSPTPCMQDFNPVQEHRRRIVNPQEDDVLLAPVPSNQTLSSKYKQDPIDSLSRRLGNVAAIFKDNNYRFSGSYSGGESLSLHRFKQLYRSVIEQYEIPDPHRVENLTLALRGPALDFFMDQVQNVSSTLEEAFCAFDRRFDSAHSRAQAQSYLESLTIAAIMEAERCSAMKALELAQSKISSVGPMCGPAFQHDSHKSRWLAQMLKSEDWAQDACTARMPHAHDYPTFVASLHAALTQRTIANTNSQPHEPMVHATHYGRQYALPRRRRPFTHRRRPIRRTQKQLEEIKSRTRCLKCNQLGHWRAECPRRDISITDAVGSRLAQGGDAHDTLLALTADEDQQTDYLHDISENHPTPNPNDNEADPFETLLNLLDLTEQREEQNSVDPTATHGFPNNHVNDSTATINLLTNVTTIFHKESNVFCGALIDTGAQKTVIGEPQALEYFKLLQTVPHFGKTCTKYRFGEQVVIAKRTMRIIIRIIIPTPNAPLILRIDVVPYNIPFLLGLDTLTQFELELSITRGELHNPRHGWRIQLSRDHGHLHWRWDPTLTQERILLNSISTHDSSNRQRVSIRNLSSDPNHGEPTEENPPPTSGTNNPYSKAQLMRIHKHFGHANARKLYDLLRRLLRSPPPNTLTELEDIVVACTICAEFSPRPLCFRVRWADKVLFNHRITMDLMWLPARIPAQARATSPCLHIVDTGTRFNAASFLSGESTSEIWNIFVKIWCSNYIGMPNSMLVDQGAVFLSDEWRFACETNAIELVTAGTESHNSLGAGETFHTYLRRAYNKVHKDHPTLPDDLILALAINALNGCAGPKGLCPSLLVFGTTPRLPSSSRRDHASQLDRFRAAATARREYEAIVNQGRLALAARKPTPAAKNAQYLPGDLVYVYRERLRRFTGPPTNR